MDGSDRYKQLVSDAVDKGLRVFGYYGSSVTFELKNVKVNEIYLLRMLPQVSQVKLQEQTLKLQAKPQKMKTSRRSVKLAKTRGS